MRCPRCGAIFCDDNAGELALNGRRKQFCSETCRHKAATRRTGAYAGQRRRYRQRVTCEFKITYRQEWRAEKAVTWLASTGREARAYVCAVCGLWHVSDPVKVAAS